jgi:hypothetical protein
VLFFFAYFFIKKESAMKAASEITVLTLGAAITLAAGVVQQVLGKNTSETLDGELITPNQLYQVMGQRITARLVERQANKGA